MRKLVWISLLFMAAPAMGTITGMRTLPGGTSTYVQYNAGGNFAGDADMTFNGTTLTVSGLSATILSVQSLGVTYGISAATGAFSGALSAATLDTGQGDNELFDMNQNVQTTDSVVFLTVDTGQGANELYDMNQNVQTSDSPTFVGLTLSGLTDTRVLFAGSGGVIQNDSDMTFNGTTVTVTGASHTDLSVSGTITTGLTASRAIATNASSQLAVSAVTSTELGFLSGVTSAIQTQINALVVSTDGWTSIGVAASTISATSVSLVGDWTTTLAVGDKIKLTNSTVKYFYVLSVAYSSVVSTVTFVTNSDYSISNNAVTLPYYSHAASPLGFPYWFSYTTTYTGWSANPTGQVTKFAMNGRIVHVQWDVPATSNGTSNATTATMTLPTTCADDIVVPVSAFDNANILGSVRTTVGSATINLYHDIAFGAWATSGGKAVRLSLTYRL